MKYIIFMCFLFVFLSGCGFNKPHLNTSFFEYKKEHIHSEFYTPVCIKPYKEYNYHICSDIHFRVDELNFIIYKGFKTDLASIPKILWPVLSPFHSSLIRPAIVHDWFYRNPIFTRQYTDLIFYHMLKNDGIGTFRALIMYYGVRSFGWNFYNKGKKYE